MLSDLMIVIQGEVYLKYVYVDYNALKYDI